MCTVSITVLPCLSLFLLLVVQCMANLGHALFAGSYCWLFSLCLTLNMLCVWVSLSVVQFFDHALCAGLTVSCTVCVWLWPCFVCGSHCQLHSLCLTLTMLCLQVSLSVVQFVSGFDHALCAGLTISCTACVWLWPCFVCRSHCQLYSLCLILMTSCRFYSTSE